MSSLPLMGRLVQGVMLPQHPSYLVFFITSRCNCSCPMCFNRRNVEATEKPPEVTLTEVKKLARSISPLPQLLLSGGEPFIREDVSEIVHYFYRHSGTRQVSIPTNGALTGTIVPSVTRMLRQCPDLFLNVNFSIDGIGEEHDRSRRLDGCFNRLTETYQRLVELRRRNPRLSLNAITIIKSDNAQRMMEIIKHIRGSFDLNYHSLGLVRGDVEFAETDFDMDSVEQKLDELYSADGGINKIPVFNRLAPAMSKLIRRTMKDARSSPQRNFHCLAGRKIVVVTSEGDLYPCEPLWLEPDIRKSSDMTTYRMAALKDHNFNIKAALRTDKAKAINHYIDQKKCSCQYACAMLNSIMYCPKMYPRYLKEIIWV